MWTKQLEIMCCITLFTYFGAFTRMILSSLSSYLSVQFLPNFIGSFFLANIFGCYVMGMFVSLIPVFYPKYKIWFIGVTSGYCGSCTTFSTWQSVAAEKFAQKQFGDGLMTLVLTFCTSYMAFIFGKNIGEIACTYAKSREQPISFTDSATTPRMVTNWMSSGESICRFRILLTVTCFLTAILWTVILLDLCGECYQHWWVAAALGPIGSLIRYGLQAQNRSWQWFPYITFSINFIASWNTSLMTAIYTRISCTGQYADLLKSYDLWVNYGLGDGILGCFSTVSTFVDELHSLASKKIFYAYRYGILSVVAAQVSCFLIYQICGCLI